MSRDHIEFIQNQSLPRQQDPFFPDIDCRMLSMDPYCQAYTALHFLHSGQQWLAEHPLTANEEFYVLSGSFHLNGFEYAAGCYAFLPAGYPRQNCIVMEDTVVLRMFDCAPQPFTGQEDAIERAQHRPAIPFLDTYRMQWDRHIHDIKLAHLGLGRKNLRTDPLTGQRTFLFMTSPQTHPVNWRGPRELHPTPEEAFLIAGDLTGEYGTMQPGAYFWRPPGVAHGPYGSKGGSISLIRFVGGAHVNVWTEELFNFSYNTPYRPVLPEAMQQLAVAPVAVNPF